MNNIRTFFFNGQTYRIYQNKTLQEILNYFAYYNEIYIVEYNKTLCDKKKCDKILVGENDKIEIVTIVGGG